MQAFIDSGFIDSFRTLHAEPHNYSWWSYRANARNNNKGWRIDYCMLSEPIGNNLLEAGILPNEKHSDHCPVWVKIKR
jgi:exodeoxyribonuclease III